MTCQSVYRSMSPGKGSGVRNIYRSVSLQVYQPRQGFWGEGTFTGQSVYRSSPGKGSGVYGSVSLQASPGKGSGVRNIYRPVSLQVYQPRQGFWGDMVSLQVYEPRQGFIYRLVSLQVYEPRQGFWGEEHLQVSQSTGLG